MKLIHNREYACTRYGRTYIIICILLTHNVVCCVVFMSLSHIIGIVRLCVEPQMPNGTQFHYESIKFNKF